MVPLKPDAKQIQSFLNALAEQNWLKRDERHWWPKFLFHYTDIRNAVKILEVGYLHSRKYAETRESLVISSGSSDVLASTSTAIKDCVRLYFRPKTPTQYYAEGIRSRSTLLESKFSDAHCPVPIFFLFDSVNILSRKSCRFSDDSLSSRKARIFSKVSELKRLPWKEIYHTGWIDLPKKEKSAIVFHRQAEVIIPQRLDLDAFRYIYCRSEAERETLLYLLPPKLREKYQTKIISTTRSVLFYRQHTFVEKVRLSSTSADFYFSPDTKSLGPFQLRIEFKIGSSIHSHKEDDFTLKRDYKLALSFTTPIPIYTIRLFLDRHLAYVNTYEESDIPF